MTPVNSKVDQQRIKLWEATLQSIVQSGFDKVTLQSIALTAGLSKGGLTYYYSSKQQLFIDAFVFFFDQVFDDCANAAQSLADPIDKLLYFSIILNVDDPSLKMAHPILHDFMAIAAHDKLYRDIYAQWVERWVEFLRVIIVEGVESGSIICQNVDDMARTLSTLLQGMATRAFLSPETHPCDWSINAYTTFVRNSCSPHRQKEASV